MKIEFCCDTMLQAMIQTVSYKTRWHDHIGKYRLLQDGAFDEPEVMFCPYCGQDVSIVPRNIINEALTDESEEV